MALTHDDRIRAVGSCAQSCTPVLSAVTREVAEVASLSQLFRLLLDDLLCETINVKYGLSDSDAGKVLKHSDMTGASEVSGMKDAVTIDQQQLWPLLGSILLQAIKQDLVDRNLLEGKEARHVWVLSRLNLMVFINNFHLRVLIHNDVCNTVLLVVLAIRYVNCSHP